MKIAAGVTAAMLLGVSPAGAQAPGLDVKNGRATILLPSVLTGPGTMGPLGVRRFCSPRAIGLTEWRVSTIERMVRPDEAQKATLTALAEVSAKAISTISAACQGSIPGTSSSQMEAIEKRLEAALETLKTVRPAFEAFYGSLNEKQKASLDVLGPHRRGWRW